MRRRKPSVLVAWTMPSLLSLLLLTAGRWVRAQKAVPGSARSAVDAAEATRLFKTGSAAFAAGDLLAARASFARLVKLAPRVAAAHAALGAVLLAQNDLAAALPELREAHRLDPSDQQSALHLAIANSRAGHYGEALEGFRALSPESAASLQPAERMAYARALANTGDPSGAEAQLLQTLRQGPAPTAELLDTLGAVQAQQAHYEPALQSFRQALTLDQAYAPAHAHLGSWLLLQGHPTDALAELQRAQQLGDGSLTTQVELGRALSASGKDAEAVTLLRKAVAREPNSLEAQYGLALALQAAGQSSEALPLFARVTAARPQDAAALLNHGLALVQTGDARGALLLYQRAAVLDPHSVTLQENMGAAYLQLNDIDRAIKAFQDGLHEDAQNPQLHYDLGLAYKLKDDLPRAIQELQQAEALDAQLPDPPYTLGVIRMQQGNTAEATLQLSRAVSLNPNNGQAWSLLGSVQKDAGNLSAASDALRHAAALDPEQPNTHVLLASILASTGDRDGAAAERKTAAALSRKAMEAQRAGFALRSGKSLLAQGDTAGAILQLNDAIAAEPDLKEAHLLLAEALQKQGRKADAMTERQKAEKLPVPR